VPKRQNTHKIFFEAHPTLSSSTICPLDSSLSSLMFFQNKRQSKRTLIWEFQLSGAKTNFKSFKNLLTLHRWYKIQTPRINFFSSILSTTTSLYQTVLLYLKAQKLIEPLLYRCLFLLVSCKSCPQMGLLKFVMLIKYSLNYSFLIYLAIRHNYYFFRFFPI
jgi:hypothetical protein